MKKNSGSDECETWRTVRVRLNIVTAWARRFPSMKLQFTISTESTQIESDFRVFIDQSSSDRS